MTRVSRADLSPFLAAPAERNFTQWGRGLSLVAYMRRADVLDVYEHAADGNLRTWVLAPRSDPHTLDFFCACDTFRRRVLVLSPSASEPEDALTYGVASVFCPQQRRGRGYATHMMCLLHHVLAAPVLLPSFPHEWGEPPIPPADAANARFSALWSDIGPAFYPACGPAPGYPSWTVRDSNETIWPVETRLLEFSPAELQWLSEEDCLALWEEDALHVAAQLCARPSTPPTVVTRCTFLPHYGLAAFQLRRSWLFLPDTLDASPPNTWGLRISAGRTYATYVIDIRPRPLTLLVTRLCATPTDFLAILAALMYAAREHGTEFIEVWNLSPNLLETARALGGRTAPRDEHLSALAWYGPEDPKDVEWVFNEKFCWC